MSEKRKDGEITIGVCIPQVTDRGPTSSVAALYSTVASWLDHTAARADHGGHGVVGEYGTSRMTQSTLNITDN